MRINMEASVPILHRLQVQLEAKNGEVSHRNIILQFPYCLGIAEFSPCNI